MQETDGDDDQLVVAGRRPSGADQQRAQAGDPQVRARRARRPRPRGRAGWPAGAARTAAAAAPTRPSAIDPISTSRVRRGSTTTATSRPSSFPNSTSVRPPSACADGGRPGPADRPRPLADRARRPRGSSRRRPAAGEVRRNAAPRPGPPASPPAVQGSRSASTASDAGSRTSRAAARVRSIQARARAGDRCARTTPRPISPSSAPWPEARARSSIVGSADRWTARSRRPARHSASAAPSPVGRAFRERAGEPAAQPQRAPDHAGRARAHGRGGVRRRGRRRWPARPDPRRGSPRRRCAARPTVRAASLPGAPRPGRRRPRGPGRRRASTPSEQRPVRPARPALPASPSAAATSASAAASRGRPVSSMIRASRSWASVSTSPWPACVELLDRTRRRRSWPLAAAAGPSWRRRTRRRTRPVGIPAAMKAASERSKSRIPCCRRPGTDRDPRPRLQRVRQQARHVVRRRPHRVVGRRERVVVPTPRRPATCARLLDGHRRHARVEAPVPQQRPIALLGLARVALHAAPRSLGTGRPDRGSALRSSGSTPVARPMATSAASRSRAAAAPLPSSWCTVARLASTSASACGRSFFRRHADGLVEQPPSLPVRPRVPVLPWPSPVGSGRAAPGRCRCALRRRAPAACGSTARGIGVRALLKLADMYQELGSALW